MQNTASINSGTKEGYDSLVQAGLFELVREIREITRYRLTDKGFDCLSGLSAMPDFEAEHREHARFIIDQFRHGKGFQVDLFIADKANE